MLVSVSHTGLVRLWDLVNSSYSDHEVKFKGTVRCIDVSSQSGLLAIGLVDGRIILWNVKTRKHLGRLRLYRDPVMSLAISPEGTSLACTYSVPSNRVAIYDLGPIIGDNRPV